MSTLRGFTLIELLIVVAIIAILAAIAVPNFLEAQVRAKVSRALADLRTIATGLEAYTVDHNAPPPNDGDLNVIPVELTTPVAFLTDKNLVDPFALGIEDYRSALESRSRYYTYTRIVTYSEAAFWASVGRPCPNEGIDHWSLNDGAFEKYGKWRLVCVGPDRAYLSLDFPPPLRGSDVPYDATNGTRSFGNILRTQKNAPIVQ
jgi:prepilin-type N-terminal cleavage/methylation domain-containing protein